MKTKDLVIAAAVAVAVYLIARRAMAGQLTAQKYGVKNGSEQANMLAAQDEGLTW